MNRIFTLLAFLSLISVAKADDNIRDHAWQYTGAATGTGAAVNQTSPSISGLTTTGALTVSGTLTGSGISTYLAAPPAIGGTTPAAATFTSVAFPASYSGATWTTVSPILSIPTLTLNDTTGSGTIATKAAFAITSPTFTSTTAQTDTVAATLYVKNPVAGSGVTFTNSYAIYTDFIYSTGYYGTGASLSSYSSSGGRVIISSTAPTITSGFGTSPTLGSNCTSAGCDLTVGTSPGTTGVMGFPTTTNYWNCVAQDVTTPAELVRMSAHSSTSVTFTFYNASGTATAPTASDDIAIQCLGH